MILLTVAILIISAVALLLVAILLPLDAISVAIPVGFGAALLGSLISLLVHEVQVRQERELEIVRSVHAFLDQLLNVPTAETYQQGWMTKRVSSRKFYPNTFALVSFVTRHRRWGWSKTNRKEFETAINSAVQSFGKFPEGAYADKTASAIGTRYIGCWNDYQSCLVESLTNIFNQKLEVTVGAIQTATVNFEAGLEVLGEDPRSPTTVEELKARSDRKRSSVR